MSRVTFRLAERSCSQKVHRASGLPATLSETLHRGLSDVGQREQSGFLTSNRHRGRKFRDTGVGFCMFECIRWPVVLTHRSCIMASFSTKWGSALEAGFQQIPDVLIRAQRLLELDSLDLAIVLNITMHWWEENDLPYPRPSMIAKRIGVSTRTVERRLAELARRGLVSRLPSETKENGVAIRRFDLSGLVHRLEALADANLAMRPRTPPRGFQAHEGGSE
jgi:hypothetical protein